MATCTTCGGIKPLSDILGFEDNPLAEKCVCTGGGLVIKESLESVEASNSKCCVVSVNGKDGVVKLSTSDIPEGNSKYFTVVRSRESIGRVAPINYDTLTGLISHEQSGVSAGTYGNEVNIPVINVDKFGHITSISNKPITVGGNQSPDVAVIGSLTGTGYLARIGSNLWGLREIAGSAGKIKVTNGDPISLNTVIDLEEVQTVTPGIYGSAGKIPTLQVDQYGRVLLISERNESIGGGAGLHTHSLGDLSNVAVSVNSPSTIGSVLAWDGSQWTIGAPGGVLNRNGITNASGYLELGGSLIRNTSVSTGQYEFSIVGTDTNGWTKTLAVGMGGDTTAITSKVTKGPISVSSIMNSAGIYQSVDADTLNRLRIQHLSSGIRWFKIVAGSESPIFSIWNNASTKDIQLHSYPQSRNDGIAPINVLHTNAFGELMSSPIAGLVPALPTKTSDLLNDGEDGITAFITGIKIASFEASPGFAAKKIIFTDTIITDRGSGVYEVTSTNPGNVPIITIDAVIGVGIVTRNSSAPIAGLTSGSNTVTSDDFYGKGFFISRGGTVLPSQNPGDGSMYYTQNPATNYITFLGNFAAGESIRIQTIN